MSRGSFLFGGFLPSRPEGRVFQKCCGHTDTTGHPGGEPARGRARCFGLAGAGWRAVIQALPVRVRPAARGGSVG